MNMFEGVRSGTPQCELTSRDDEACGIDSAVRIRTECKDCGHPALRFACDPHFRGLGLHKVLCYHCKSANIGIKVS